MHDSMIQNGRNRLKIWLAACGLLAFALGAAPGCSGDDGGGAGDSCEVDADCKEGLRCRDEGDGKVCVEPTGGNNGDTDAGDTTNNDTDADGGQMVTEEEYFISYVTEAVNDGSLELRVLSTADQTETTVDVTGVDCTSGCWINRNASHVIYQKPTVSGPAGSGDIFKIELDESFVPQGDDSSATEIAQGVTSVDVIDNIVTYRRGESAYYHSLADGSETEIGVVGDGGYFVDAEANVAMIFDPVPATAQNLDIYLGDANGQTQKVFQINSENYQEIGGSYYGQNVPAAVTPDGSIAAIVTSGPNNYDKCNDASECSGPEQKCGFQGFCTRRELTVRFIEVANQGDLGMPCGGEGTCGEIHECYQPSDGTEDAVCIPGRVVVGVPKSPERRSAPGEAQVNGCELTKDSLDSNPYTTLNGPFAFDAEGNLYGVGVRNCTEQTGAGYSNIPQGDIIKIDPRAGSVERVYGNFGEQFDPNACYDVDEMEFLPEACNVYVESAMMSPGGNEFAFTATNMNVTDPRLANTILDVWTVLSDGSGVEWEGQHDQNVKIKSFNVHPAP